jgi:hypothetical protein
MTQKDKLNELQNRLGEIFNGIDDYYSQSILDELITRIDTTIDDFNKEFLSLVGKLNIKPTKKDTIKRAPTKTAIKRVPTKATIKRAPTKTAIKRVPTKAAIKIPTASRSRSKTLK